MTSFRTIALLFAILGISFAIQCYSDTTNGKDKPSKTEECNSLYCTKINMNLNGNSASAYGCDQTQMCKKEECFTAYGGSQVCCCSGNKCNSSSKLSSILAILPVVFLKLF